MRLTFSFQTLIITVLAASLTLATTVWAVSVYQSIYSIILNGFDRKLLAVAGGAAVFTDGDAHGDYQRPHRITAMCGSAQGPLIGFDEERQIFVTIDQATGAALRLTPPPKLPPTPPRELACDPTRGELVALDTANELHVLAGPAVPTVLSTAEIDEILHVDGAWWALRGTELSALDSTGAKVTIDTQVERLAYDRAGKRFIGVRVEAGEVVIFSRDGKSERRFDINLDGRQIHGLAAQGDHAYLASDGLITIDLANGTMPEDPPPPGYYSEADPFIDRVAPAYRNVREAAGLTFLYTQTSLGDDQIRYILDGSVGDAHTPPGYLDVVPEDSLEDIQLAFSEGTPVVSDIREWETWGLLKFAAEPIYGSDGSIVALAGADVDIGVIRGKTRIALFAVLAVGIVLMILASWVSYRVSQGLTRPLREIKGSALRIAAGYFDTTLPKKGRDEIATLASSLNTLSTRLQTQMRQSQTYEQTLVSGRMQLALEHALADQLATNRTTIPELHGSAGPEYCAVGSDSAVFIWSLDASTNDLDRSIANNRCAALVTGLLAGLSASTTRDEVFRSLPMVAALILWERTSMTLSVRSRTSLLLRLEEPGEPAKMLTCTDRSIWVLKPTQRVHFGGSWVLQPLVSA